MRLIKQLLIIGTILIFLASNAQTGLVAHWSFDTITNSKFTNHVNSQAGGTVYGCQSVPGMVGNALSFDGVDDYVRIPGDSLTPPVVLESLAEGSISVWFKVEDIPLTDGIRPIFYYGNNNACNFFDAANEGLIIEVGHSPIHYASKRLYFTIWSNGCTLPSFCYDSWNTINENEWYHFVAVVGNNYNTGYLNGQLMTDRVYNFGTANTQEFFANAIAHESLWIGKGHWNTSDVYFKGAIDELKIFDHPVDQQEVTNLFLEGSIAASIPQSDLEINGALIYPNPAQKDINIKIPLTFEKPLTFEIYSPNGVIVYKALVSESDKTFSINLDELPSGIYLYTLKEGSRTIKKDKLIIQ